MLALFVACSDDDDKDNELPIVGLEFPKFENPVKPGESITIKGEGFTKASEIWFRTIIARAENTGDVKAIVTEVNSTGITFTAPEVYGNQSVLLKENGKEYELGKMTFEEQPEEGGDVEILPKKVKKIIYSDTEQEIDQEIYEYTYNKENKIASVKVTKSYGNRTENKTYTYSTDKITMKTTGGEDEEEFVFNLQNGKLISSKFTYTDMDEVYADNFVYTYAGGYLSKIEGTEEEEYNKMVETYSFIQGNLMKYTYNSNDDYKEIQEFSYDNQLNNLNIDLFPFITYITFSTESVTEPFLLDIAGKRSQHLPSSIKYTSEDEEEGTEVSVYKFSYKMEGDYISEIIIDDEGDIITFKIFYED